MKKLSSIVLSLTAILTFAVRNRLGKYALLMAGSLFLSSCLSLRLGKNESPQQAPARAEVTYIDRVPAGEATANPQNH
jgi:hypothetical protein